MKTSTLYEMLMFNRNICSFEGYIDSLYRIDRNGKYCPFGREITIYHNRF
ncbi:MAG: hypothetical protein ACQES1_01840 [Bacteroidota bacterium]